MALKITKWNFIKIFLFVFDIAIISINIALFIFTYYLIRKEYNTRSSLKLFLKPFFVSILNVLLDIIMNKTNLRMKYAGHNRYGMITRFFMFYFVLSIIIYTDQREKYVIKNREDNINDVGNWIHYLGLIDIGLILFSMILSFFIIDIQNVNQILVKKKKNNERLGEELNIILNENDNEKDKD